MPRFSFSLLLAFILAHTASANDYIAIHIGVDEDGLPTSAWLDAIKPRIPTEEFDRIRTTERPLSGEESAWLELIREVAPSWIARRKSLLIPFPGIDQPERVAILVGNQIGDDGFTFAEDTVCFDLAALAKNYGDPKSNENRNRLTRFLDHEYTHLLHHAWLRKHPISLATPLDRALRDMIVEGVGNYRSLSAKWVAKDGALTELAKNTLSELQPVLVDRLIRLRTASTDEEAALTAGLSRGPFNKKWGALTVALWLASATGGDDRELRAWVKAGPNGIFHLAGRNLPRNLKHDLETAFPHQMLK